ncbi:hypothetical protein L9F63_027551, partial [Diploptera punctata]
VYPCIQIIVFVISTRRTKNFYKNIKASFWLESYLTFVFLISLAYLTRRGTLANIALFKRSVTYS